MIRVLGWGLVLLIGVACASQPAPMAAAPAARCEPGDTSMVRDVVYFGRNRPGGGVVSESEWQGFLDQVVTPRFPDGLTVVHAEGQWKGRSGAVERERAEVLTLLHGGTEETRNAVSEVVGEYKRRFGQEAVLRERLAACASF
jgi:predicted phage tail protein